MKFFVVCFVVVIMFVILTGSTPGLEQSLYLAPIILIIVGVWHAAVAKKSLLKRGEELKSEGRVYETMFDACRAGDKEAVELFLARGAMVNLRDEEGKSLLHHAAECGHTQLVQLLLEKGANVHAHSKDGFTPADLASDRDHKKIIELLNTVAK